MEVFDITDFSDFPCDYDPIYVTKGQHVQPALMRTCRQLRKEARSMYTENNMFIVSVGSSDLPPHRGHWVWWNADPEWVEVEDGLMWSTLLEWLQQYHAGTIDATPSAGGGWCGCNQMGRLLAFDMFSLVDEMKDSPWEKIARVVGVFQSSFESLA